MSEKDWPRVLITALILAAFAGALTFKYSPGLEETLKAIVMLAVGYWLGSSKGSSDKSTQLEELTVKRPTGKPNDPVHVEGAEHELDQR